MTKEFDRSLAVVIGINDYQNGIDTLQTAIPDAFAIAEILNKSYKYKLVHPKFESEVIVNQYATKERLETLLKDILPNKIKPTESDRLIFYFAGHGIARNSDEGPEGYLVPQDADMKDRGSLLKMREIHDWLAQLECRHLLVILDCCFAGTFRWASYRKLIPISQDITEAHYDRFIKFPAWQVLTSASYNQGALEFLNNRDVEPNRKHSPFAEGLIEALQQEKGDLNNDGIIIATELYLYLRDYVELNSKDRQTPGFFPLKKHDRGEYIFKLPNTPLNLKKTPELSKENNPYRGLDPFEEKHAALFFGREEVIKELFTKVSQPHHQLTVVSGISGSGKSSLVQAGLIPCLRKNQAQQWLIFDPIRPGTNPYTSLARVLSQLDSNPAEQSGDSPILGKQAQDKSSQFIQKIKTWGKQNPNSHWSQVKIIENLSRSRYKSLSNWGMLGRACF
ncbi:MAG: caspase family protein [Pleurocapsa sp. MO_226.B13]|nr:caspase family protein [Pleurocapsa sp. MO_226.B13]